ALLKQNEGAGPGPLVPSDSIVWDALASFSSRFREDLVYRISLKPVDAMSYLARLDASPGDNHYPSMWHAGLGDGRIRVVDRLQHADNASAEFEEKLTGRIQERRSAAESIGGALILEHASAKIRARVNAWGSFGSSAGLMQRVKQQLDPDEILSPGRFDFTS